MTETVVLFRPTGPGELELVRATGFKRWPPRLPGQSYFYPVTNAEYATEITQRWNVPEHGVGYVTRFEVTREFMTRYEVKTVGATRHQEWWIPAEDLDALNRNIIGTIEVVGTYQSAVR